MMGIEHDLPTAPEDMATVSMSRGGAPMAAPMGRLESPVPHRIGRFVVIDEIGRGGMGVVFSAYDPQLDRRVALKLLRTRHPDGGEGRARMLREAQAMARLSHPNVVTIYDVGVVDDAVFLAMELVSGRTLRSWLEDLPVEGSWPRVVATLRQAGEGLAAAHRAGLVHRDFKPDNVLVDEGGRARVLDFGLARRGGAVEHMETSADGEIFGDSRETFVTRTGYVVGTPGYMPPAQLRGEAADALGDQFAFCVVLYRALYRERPFRADTVEEYLEVMRDEPTPSDRHDVPPWLHRVILRGLSYEPKERHADMEALLTELRPPPNRFRRRVGSGVVGLALGLSVWAYHANTQEPAALASVDPCAGAEQRLSGIWDDDRRETIRHAFAQTHLDHAATAWEHVDVRMGELTDRWVDAQRQICAATRVDGQQSGALLVVRQACLETRLSELRAHTMVLSRSDPGVVDSAIEAVDRLRDPAECRTVRTMQVDRPLPEDADQATAVVELRRRLDDVDALIEAGQLPEALAIGRQVEQDADALGFLPVLAEARLRLGLVLDARGDYEEAAQVLQQALWAAEVGRHDAAAVDIWGAWIWVVGYHQRQHEQVEPLLLRLDAALHRLGDDPLREAKVNKVLGTLAFTQWDFQRALVHFDEAVKLIEQALGSGHVDTGSYYQNLGTALYRLGRQEESSRMLRKAEAIWTAHLGPMHPRMASLHLSQGTLAMTKGEVEQAVEHYRRALEIFENVHPPTHPEAVAFHRNLGDALLAAGHPEQSIAVLQRALALEASADLPSRSPHLTAMTLGRAMVEAGHYREAVELLEPVVETIVDDPDPQLGSVPIRAMGDLARARWEVQPAERANAVGLVRRALRMLGDKDPGLREQLERWLVEHEAVSGSGTTAQSL